LHFIAVQLAEPLQKLWMHLGHSIVEGGHNNVGSLFADKGCRYVDCGSAAFHCPYSIQAATSKIIDALLMLY
jgi:hypothetical protein